jgi:DNA topoisomerase IA
LDHTPSANVAGATTQRTKLLAACAGNLKVAQVEAKPRSRSPQGPFRTSTLQQAAANRLGFSARKTMQLATSHSILFLL